MSIGADEEQYMCGAPFAVNWVMHKLARFSVFAFTTVPARVTGAEPPERDMDIDATGIPNLANSAIPSTAPSSNESGAIEQQMTDMIGLFLRASSPPAT